MDENALICPPAFEEAFKLPLPLGEGTKLFSFEEEK
jgi:hypothetical protein